MTTILELVATAEAALREVALVERGTLSDDELVGLMKVDEAVGRFSDVSRVLDAAELAERSRYELGAAGLSMRLGERKPANLVEKLTRVSQAEAWRRIRIGAAIRPRQSLVGEVLPAERPIVAEAMTHGLIGVDTANTILYSLKQAAAGAGATPETMDAAELDLVQLGTTSSADLIADAGRLWRDAMDPDGIEPRYEEIRERSMVTIGRERNGIKTYTVKADPETSALLDAIFIESMDPKVGPRFLSDEDRERAETVLREVDGRMIETLVDPRPIERRRIDALKGGLLAALRATREGPTDMRTVGTVTAIIALKDLQAGTGFGIIEGTDEVIPASVIQQLACENGFEPVVVGNLGQPLYYGTLKRYFTRAQRRAAIARDGDRCIVPGCKCRAATSDAHHVIFAVNGGPTNIDNLVILCPAHHHALHQGAFEIRMIDGIPYYRSSADRFDDNSWQSVSRTRLLLATA